MSKTPTPLESFGPELMAALLRGAREEVRLKMPYKTCIRFRMRIYQMRNQMRADNNPEYHLASRTRVQIKWGKEVGLPPVENIYNAKNVARPSRTDIDAYLILSPHDSDFTQALTAAGVKVDMKDDPLIELAKAKPESGSTFLADFVTKEK